MVMPVFSSTATLRPAPVQNFEHALGARGRENFLRVLYLSQFPEASAALIYAASMAGQIGWSHPVTWTVLMLSAICIRFVVLNRALTALNTGNDNINWVLVANFACGFWWGASVYYFATVGTDNSLFISIVWMVGLLVSALGIAAVSTNHSILHAGPIIGFLLSKLFTTGDQVFQLMAFGVILLVSFFGAIVYFTRGILRRDFHREMQNAALVKQLSETNAYAEQLNMQLRSEIERRETIESKLLKERDRAEKLSTIDSLTGIQNRRAFDNALLDELARARRSGNPLSLVLIDVDRFKNCNDARGHIAGDEVLRRVARIIERSIRRGTDKNCRYGGEEFAVLLPNTDSAQAARIAETIRIELENEQITHPDSDVGPYITISLGVASAEPCDFKVSENLFDVADKALYLAKSCGRNQTQRSC
ncbi:MAG: diguanylate cyclase [Gammaproteobacteria bacterium]